VRALLSLHLTESGDDSLLGIARQADRCGLAALWLPSFPPPAVTAAAVVVATRRLGVRGVLAQPLHNPIRVAEEWALVDNLSSGRAGLALDPAGDCGEIETVRRLWRGEAARVPDGEGRPIEIRILPQPIQRELPLWLADSEAAMALGALTVYRSAGGQGPITAVVPAFVSVAEGLREVERWSALGAGEIACRAGLADALGTIEILTAMLQREDSHGG
jgi:alkanesulfonate monooxygenase SsuD/methylene tetrahydromethanopterin reductase-like flavin-dependent oxidoreductase (luciferase family)